MGSEPIGTSTPTTRARRWGLPGERLAVGLARLHHNPHESDTMAPSDGGHEGMHQAQSR